jgi:hypothetical protein
MKGTRTTPLEMSFWLSSQERLYLLVIGAIFMVGLTVRYFYLKDRAPDEYVPSGAATVESRVEKGESHHE